MSIPQATLKSSIGLVVYDLGTQFDLELEIENRIDFREMSKATDGANTISVPEEAIQEFQSIIPLKGKYINDPSWDDLPAFLATYWQEIEDNNRD